MAIEFNLLYRWHGLVPSKLRIGGRERRSATRSSTRRWSSSTGWRALLEDASAQPAGRIGLFNTDRALRDVELASIREARAVQLARYNDYRALAAFPRVTRLRPDHAATRECRARCATSTAHVDRIEFYAGLFAEDLRPNSVLPSLMGRMVGVDAFSQALTNPLLSPRVFNAETFSPLAWRPSPARRGSRRSCNGTSERAGRYRATMTCEDWQRV